MPDSIQPGQRFRISNIDYSVHSDEWTVIAVAGAQITFEYLQHNVVDIAYVHYTSAGTVVGTIIRRDGDGLVISFAGDPYGAPLFKGLLLRGDTAAYLTALDPPKFF